MKKPLLLLELIALIIATGINAQQINPGGVQGTKAWFVTAPVTPNHSRWVDKSGHGLILKQGANNEFQWENKEHNFHKSLLFFRDDVYFDLPYSAGRQLTTFGLFNPYQYSNAHPTEFLLYDVICTGNNESFNMSTDKVYAPGGAIQMDYGSTSGDDLYFRLDSFRTNRTLRYHTSKILSHYKAEFTNHSIWGESDVRIYINKNRSGINKILYFIPEFIVYDRCLTMSERLRIESYMGRKYAIPLQTSYLSPGNGLLWDYTENRAYNNRMIYVGREDESDLYQPQAVSSYEHYFLNNTEGLEGVSESGSNSTSDNRHWNNRDRNRLLVFGLQQFDSASYTAHGAFSGLSNGEYYMLGDDAGNLSVEATDSSGLAGLSTIGRQWLVKTNTSPRAVEQVNWSGTGSLQTTSLYNTQSISLLTGVDKGTHILISDQQVKYPSPGISFSIPYIRNEREGDLYVGFTNSNSPSSFVNFGIKIRADGQVYLVEKGRQSSHIDGYTNTRHRGFKMELEGDELVFYYQYHHQGTSIPYSRRIKLSPDEQESLKYGLVRYDGTGDGVLVENLKTTGFSQQDHSTFLELRGSYNHINNLDYNGMPGMPNVDPRDNKTVWLLIDPEGKGNFTHDGVKRYRADEITGYGKGKYLFNNIPWDADGSGSDVFTFGYSPGTIVARVEHIDADCEKAGFIKVSLDEGEELDHQLDIYNSGDTLVYTSNISLQHHKLAHLDPGSYRVVIHNPVSNEEVYQLATIGKACDMQEEEEAIPAKDHETSGMQVRMYPNPTRAGTDFTIETQLPEASPVLYLVYDLTGAVIDQFERPGATDFHQLTYRIGQPGVYIVKIITQSGEENRKVYIQ